MLPFQPINLFQRQKNHFNTPMKIIGKKAFNIRLILANTSKRKSLPLQLWTADNQPPAQAAVETMESTDWYVARLSESVHQQDTATELHKKLELSKH